MRSVQQKISGGQITSGESTKNLKVARVMMLFIVAYILQYWEYITYALWLVFGKPSVVIMEATVIFTNQGGVLNMLAYTLLRRMSLGVQSES